MPLAQYEGHSEIIDTPLAFWTLGETENSDHGAVQRKDWTGTNERIDKYH